MKSFNEYIGKTKDDVIKIITSQGYDVVVKKACSDKTKRTDTELVTRITALSDNKVLIVVGEFFIGV